jgi:hypothetical protein
MGFFDFLKRKKKEPKDLVKPAPSSFARPPTEKGKSDWRARKADHSYRRIHSWIESRIGPMKDIPGPEQKDRLMELLEDERAKSGRGLQSDPQAGLEAYIAKNAYRKMLE